MVEEPSYDLSEDELELQRILAAIVERKNAAPDGSAERRMAVRQLHGLRDTREEAGPMIEDLDPNLWGN